MKIRYILLVTFMLLGSASAQYLTYSELIGLLNIAHDAVKVDEYLVKRGFEYIEGENKNGVQIYDYGKIVEKYFYSAGVYFNSNYPYTSVDENSQNVARWNYYKQIVSGYGYKQTDSFTKENGDLWIYYQTKEYELIMVRWKSENKTIYRISLNKLNSK